MDKHKKRQMHNFIPQDFLDLHLYWLIVDYFRPNKSCPSPTCNNCARPIISALRLYLARLVHHLLYSHWCTMCILLLVQCWTSSSALLVRLPNPLAASMSTFNTSKLENYLVHSRRWCKHTRRWCLSAGSVAGSGPPLLHLSRRASLAVIFPEVRVRKETEIHLWGS